MIKEDIWGWFRVEAYDFPSRQYPSPYVLAPKFLPERKIRIQNLAQLEQENG